MDLFNRSYNVLAFLYNVMDVEKAKTAFRFMWGVGVNDPYPVSNLYPIVNAGDPDWRSYYTVNLLNLPNHYHNGGLWPYLGAMWVRFILRIGLREVAFGELLKLARLNRQGVAREWEFNEWAHGVTGRPMASSSSRAPPPTPKPSAAARSPSSPPPTAPSSNASATIPTSISPPTPVYAPS